MATDAVTPTAVVPITVDPRVERMIRVAVVSSKAVILVGPPGTGKTVLLKQVIEEIRQDPEVYGFTGKIESELWATPHESWTAADLIGGDTVRDGELHFRPGYLLKAIAADRWLVLDECNRADMDRIFGGLLTWFSDQDVTIGTTSSASGAPDVVLGWAGTPKSSTVSGDAGDVTKYLAGSEWRLLGTYNAVDAQRVFRFGQALGRRFVRVPVPAPTPAEFAKVLALYTPDSSASVRRSVTGLYRAHAADRATELGPALFLRMTNYVRAGLETSPTALGKPDMPGEPDDDLGSPLDEEPAEGEKMSAVERELVAEAYLVNVGTWLRHFEEDLDALGRRVVDNEGALDQAEWDWVVELSRALG